jgi:peptidoglycan hydrolase CwlO-like protein
LETRLGKLEEGQAALATGQAKLETRLEKLEEGQAALATDQKSLRTDFLDELGKTRTDVMGKLAEVRSDLTGMRDDISVNMGAVDMARQVNDNTRADVTQMREQISVMWKQLKQAQDDIRALKEERQK